MTSKCKKTAIKICGLTDTKEASYIVDNKVEYGGVVMFYPKSHRNVQEETAHNIVDYLKGNALSVAVVVSPNVSQLKTIEDIGFDYIQIHGQMDEEVYENAQIPIIRAINVKGNSDELREELINLIEKDSCENKIEALLFDGSTPGNGKIFDWSKIEEIRHGERKIMLAGGLGCYNVMEAVNKVRPDIVDVSTGVEYTDPTMNRKKDPEKICKLVNIVRNHIK